MKDKNEKKVEKHAERIALNKVITTCNRKAELETPEAQLLLKFLAYWPPADATLEVCEVIWGFILWLKSNGLHIIDQRTVYCFPFEKLITLKNLNKEVK